MHVHGHGHVHARAPLSGGLASPGLSLAEPQAERKRRQKTAYRIPHTYAHKAHVRTSAGSQTRESRAAQLPSNDASIHPSHASTHPTTGVHSLIASIADMHRRRSHYGFTLKQTNRRRGDWCQHSLRIRTYSRDTSRTANSRIVCKGRENDGINQAIAFGQEKRSKFRETSSERTMTPSTRALSFVVCVDGNHTSPHTHTHTHTHIQTHTHTYTHTNTHLFSGS